MRSASVLRMIVEHANREGGVLQHPVSLTSQRRLVLAFIVEKFASFAGLKSCLEINCGSFFEGCRIDGLGW